MEGFIFNIQKFSLNDGPGIRTVIFLKGCPLRCRWCSNPESQSTQSQVLWDADRCLRCGGCQKICRKEAIHLQGDVVCIEEPLCVRCGDCIKSCPAQALRMEGERIPLETVLATCLQDRDFYEESGGGVTFSGGEMLMQPDFVIAAAEALHREGIHTAAETTGYCAPEVFSRVAAHLDYLLYDIKHWEEGKHREGTGVSLQPILQNLRAALTMGKEILPRIPVIPGYNDSLADAEGFCCLFAELGITKVQLLPFHQFGEKKYAMLGREYALADYKPLHAEELQAYTHIFRQNKIQAFL